MESRNLAKDRLKVLLNHDRIECAVDLVDMIKSDVVDTISKYICVNDQDVEVVIKKPRSRDNETDFPVFTMKIPIIEITDKRAESDTGKD